MVEFLLQDVGIGAQSEPRVPVLNVVSGRDEEEWQSAELGIRTDAGQQLEAVHTRHFDIANDEVDPPRLQQSERRFAIDSGVHVISMRFEDALLESARRKGIVDDEDVRRSSLIERR